MTQGTIRRIRSAQEPQHRQYTTPQVKPLSQDGILKTRDANRSIRVRKEKEMPTKDRKLAKQTNKVYGYAPTQRSEDSIQRAIANEREAGEQGDN